jgi:hypothetical protein
MTTLLEPLDCECEEEEFEPRPYKDLPPEIQEKAIEKWRDDRWNRGDFDTDFITEMLCDDLEYEFGIEVSTSTQKGYNGRTHEHPDIEWDLSYCQGDGVSFKAVVDIDKVIAHGVPGCEYYSPHAAKLRELWQAVQMLEAVSMVDIDWSFGFDRKNGHARHDAYAYWDSYEGVDEDAQKVLDTLTDTMQDVLNEIYDDACRRMRKIGYSQIEYQDSNECIAEELDANDHWQFDEEGCMV